MARESALEDAFGGGTDESAGAGTATATERLERLDWLLSDRSRPDRWPGRLYEEGATACAVAKGCAAWEARVVRPASGSTKERLMSRKVSLELRLGLGVGLGYFGKPWEETGGVRDGKGGG